MSPGSSQILSKSGYREVSKPAVSETWKQQFKLQPQLSREEATMYFDKERFKPEIEYNYNELTIYKAERRKMAE